MVSSAYHLALSPSLTRGKDKETLLASPTQNSTQFQRVALENSSKSSPLIDARLSPLLIHWTGPGVTLRARTVFKLSLPLQKFSRSSRDGPRRSWPKKNRSISGFCSNFKFHYDNSIPFCLYNVMFVCVCVYIIYLLTACSIKFLVYILEISPYLTELSQVSTNILRKLGHPPEPSRYMHPGHRTSAGSASIQLPTS